MNLRGETAEGASWCGPWAVRKIRTLANSGADSYVNCPQSDRTVWQLRRSLLYVELTNGSGPRHGVPSVMKTGGDRSRRFMKYPG